MANKAKKQGSKLYVCATAQNSDLTQSAFEALTWVQVGKVGNLGDFGSESNLSSYNTLDESVTQKQKGTADAGSLQVDVASVYDDAGQVIMRTFGGPLNQDNIAVKIERNDKPSSSYTNTIFYTRGVVSGPINVGGGGDDFEVERYTVGLNQLPIRVNPTAA